MFGIKFIKESEYNELTHIARVAEERIQNVIDGRNKIERDCESLREQLNESIREANKLCEHNIEILREVKKLREFKRDTLEAMGQIDLAGFRISLCTRKCEKCENEQHECRKYEFGKHKYCVIPK